MPTIAIATALISLVLSLRGAAPEGQPAPQCPAVNKPARAKVQPSKANPQYVVYNGKTQALIGASASYLCHIEQPGTFGSPPLTPSVAYCDFTNYRKYLEELGRGSTPAGAIPAPGLNHIRLWIGLNHSPGIMRRGTAYDFETPFLKPYDTNGAPDETFFARLKCVLDEAWARDQIVEVTVFDPGSGSFETSPWRVYFQDKGCFSSKDFVLPSGETCATDPAAGARNRAGWEKQKQLITELVTRLCDHPNLYYEVANEADFNPDPAMADQIRSWHQEMTSHLSQIETKLGCGHFIAANVQVPTSIDSLPASVKALNAHYTHVADARLGANELLRTGPGNGFNGPGPDRIVGFNETKITSLVSLRDNPSFQSADAARAEAWEFLLSEGGIYDLYGEHWQSTASDTPEVIRSLKVVNGLLRDADLDRVERSGSVGHTPPAWISTRSSLPPYGVNTTRWGAMHSPMTQAGDTNFLYIHHSLLEGPNPAQRYVPQIRRAGNPYPPQAIYVVLPAGSYRAEWIDPATGAIQGSGDFKVATAQEPVLVPAAPAYAFDIALRIRRG